MNKTFNGNKTIAAIVIAFFAGVITWLHGDASILGAGTGFATTLVAVLLHGQTPVAADPAAPTA